MGAHDSRDRNRVRGHHGIRRYATTAGALTRLRGELMTATAVPTSGFDPAATAPEAATQLPSLAALRRTYQSHCALIFDALDSNVHIDAALRAHALAVDDVLIQQWHRHQLHKQPITLLAVGGYGRFELFPHSDVDILLLHDEGDAASMAGIEAFLSEAWDLGFEIGHSVRTVEDCIAQAEADITVATAISTAFVETPRRDPSSAGSLSCIASAPQFTLT